MNVLIIEDEKPAAEKLRKALVKANPAVCICATLNSVAASIEWLQKNPQPDLVMMDIALTDGLSFTIFENATLHSPVIFTTAFDEYWQEAFEHNGIEYLLKPLKQEKLEAALKKYDSLKKHFASHLQQLLQWQQYTANTYRKRLLVKRGIEYVAIKTGEIAYCYATHKLICLVNDRNQKFILDKSLSDLEKELDPAQFFRVTRKYLVNINAIKKIRSVGKGKLAVEILPSVEEDILISNENSLAFKEWMNR
jgi:two-component system LytT family response regulator